MPLPGQLACLLLTNPGNLLLAIGGFRPDCTAYSTTSFSVDTPRSVTSTSR